MPFADAAARTRRHHDLPLRAALADDRGVRVAAVGARAAVSQRDAGVVLRALRPGAVPPRGARPRTSWRRWSDASISRSATRTTTAHELESLGFDRTGVFPIAVDTARITRHSERPALDAHARRRAGEFPVRRADRAEQEDRGPHQARRGLQALRRRLLPLHLRRPVRRRAAVLFDDSRADGRVPAAQRPLHLHRPGSRRRARRLLPPCGGLHLDERARRLLRAASRSDGGRRAGARVRRGGGAGHAWRRRRSVRAEGSRGTPPNFSAALAFDDRLRAEVIAGQRRRLADFGDARITRDLTALLHTLS